MLSHAPTCGNIFHMNSACQNLLLAIIFTFSVCGDMPFIRGHIYPSVITREIRMVFSERELLKPKSYKLCEFVTLHITVLRVKIFVR